VKTEKSTNAPPARRPADHSPDHSRDRTTRSRAVGGEACRRVTVSGAFIVAYHLGLLIGLPFYFWLHPPGATLIVASVVVLFLSLIGITAAYHRFYSHRGYVLHPAAEAVLLFLGTVALQGSALRWSFDHRLHHAYVDTDRDPYSIKKGFWYAHVLWMFQPAQEIDERRVKDLVKNRLVMFQHRHYGLIAGVANLLVVAAVGWLVADWIGAVVLAGWTRLGVGHHLTWFINSLAHTWGERTYSKEHSAVDNHLLALITVGEGFHNYHHTFPSDYRNGVRWYQFDPTKWTIWTLSKLGLASNLRRHSLPSIRKRLLVEDRKLLLGALDSGAWAARREELEHTIHRLSDSIHEQLDRLGELRAKLAQRSGGRAAHQAVRQEIRRIKANLKRDWEAWFQLCGAVLEPAPA
jgi:stearoyl-CoA desaturase (delta-9 desaturase)